MLYKTPLVKQQIPAPLHRDYIQLYFDSGLICHVIPVTLNQTDKVATSTFGCLVVPLEGFV